MNNNPAFNLNIGEILRAKRRLKGYTQEYIAGEAGITQEYLSQVERGKKNPTFNVFFSVAIALETTPSQIVKEIEDEVLPDLNKNK